MKMKFLLVLCMCFCIGVNAKAQLQGKGFFSLSSPPTKDSKEYGVATVHADKHTVVIGTVMAYGENVKGLTVRINSGFSFKLAPAQNGTILNYVGASLNIVLQPGDKARFEFIDAGKTSGAKQLHISGEVIE